MVIGSSLDESMTVPCRVAGDPSVITFEWTFANSGERFDVTASGGHVHGGAAGADDTMGVVDVGQTIGQHQSGGVFDYNDGTNNHGEFSDDAIW